jgi:hypothetical protein
MNEHGPALHTRAVVLRCADHDVRETIEVQVGGRARARGDEEEVVIVVVAVARDERDRQHEQPCGDFPHDGARSPDSVSQAAIARRAPER